MAEAFAWGAIGAASLLLGALAVQIHKPRSRSLGLILAFGAGVLMSAVAYELVEEAATVSMGTGGVGLGFFAGALTYFVGDRAIERVNDRRSPDADGSPMGIVLGTVLDGIPESAVLGLTLVTQGAVGAAMLVAVFISNLPESISASSSLLSNGWSRRKVYLMWLAVTLAAGLSALAGYALLANASGTAVAFVLAFAGGAVLCMLTTTMVPEAYERSGLPTGLAASTGFAVAFFINWLER